MDFAENLIMLSHDTGKFPRALNNKAAWSTRKTGDLYLLDAQISQQDELINPGRAILPITQRHAGGVAPARLPGPEPTHPAGLTMGLPRRMF